MRLMARVMDPRYRIVSPHADDFSAYFRTKVSYNSRHRQAMGNNQARGAVKTYFG